MTINCHSITHVRALARDNEGGGGGKGGEDGCVDRHPVSRHSK